MTGLCELYPYEPNRGAAPPDSIPEQAGAARTWRRGRPGEPLELRHARTVLTAILEVRSGRRAPGQLRAVVTPRMYQHLRGAPPSPGPRYTVKSVRASHSTPGTIEICGTAHADRRATAVMARFEHSEAGWRCGFFTVVQPQRHR
ncbi:MULTISPECIES: Rv3235 family protein [Amycolatopsis]|uniref:Uncharacterized protein n=1 Tax=Amycolatopsis tucumanensis TaxID=401106 RepID=A0ABP7IP47_9PSEU|nr:MULTISPECIES: Rv3235 family protein [Amycolatopsis]MCF6428031.1 Rv3235 family protein [Amycolatopsis tucumanensis]